MLKNILLSTSFHFAIIIFAFITFPFVAKKPLDLPPLISVELIQITEKTNIPYAPKAKKIIEKVKKEEKKLVSEQAPPKKIDKKKPDAIPMPDQKVDKIKEVEEKQNPKVEETKVKQVSEFEKKDIFDPTDIAALIDKSKENIAETKQKSKNLSQSEKKKHT